MVLELHFRSSGHRSPSGCVDISARVEPHPPKKVSFPSVDSLVIVHKRAQREGLNILYICMYSKVFFPSIVRLQVKYSHHICLTVSMKWTRFPHLFHLVDKVL